MSYVVHLALIASALFSLSAFAGAPATPAAKWTPLAPKGHAECDEEKPCKVDEGTQLFEVRLQPVVKQSMKTLTKLQIKNLKTGVAELYSLDEVNKIDLGSSFELQTVSGLRPGVKATDLALYAYSSAREGKAYYYFLYDAAAGKFVQSQGTFPKLAYDAASKKYLSELQRNKFALGKDLKFSPTK